MKKTLDFKKDLNNWIKEVSKLPSSAKVLNQYQRGLITLEEAYNSLKDIELEAIKTSFKEQKDEEKLLWKNLKVGDKFLWVVDEFDGYSEDECVVTDVLEDHLLAYNVKLDIKNIWIDNDVEIKEVEGK